MVATPATTTQIGQPYSQTNVGSGGTGPYTFALASGTLPAGTTLNTSTGTVSGTPTATGFFSYSIQATDSSSPSQTATAISVGGTIGNAALTVTASSSPTQQVARPYSQANSASGGTGLYTFTVNGGSLPAGTSLNPNTGLVSGTPTTAGSFSYTILVTDSANATGSVPVAGTIAPQGFTLTSTSSTLTQVGQSYSQTNVATFGTAPVSYALTAGALPLGTSLNTSTGLVSGTPTTVGPFSYTITATDSSAGPQIASRTLTGTISPSVLTIASVPSAQTKIGQPYSQSNTASGGTPAYTYSLYAGALPLGTSLNTTTGVVSGTPSVQGLFFYSILATDSGSPALTATSTTISGTIGTAASTVSLTSSVNPSTLGQAVTFTAAVTAGATGTVTFKDGGSTLGTGTIAGTQATFMTSSLSLGDHSITAVYGGSAGFSPSTSAVLKQTVSPPASSVQLRAMQIVGTQVAASLVSQAISGAVDNAIADGFSNFGSPVTPNGAGFTFNFAAVEQPGGGAQQSGNAREPARDGVDSFLAAPDRRANRIDESFSALGYQNRRANPPPPHTYVPDRQWLPWLDIRGVNVDRRDIGNDLKGDQSNLLIGLTHRLSSQFLLGAFGGYERVNFSSDALTGHLKGNGWTVGGYMGWKIDDGVRFDVAIARSTISYDSSAGSATATFPGQRWLVSGGFTGQGRWQRWMMEPSLRAYVMWEHEDAYTDNLGVTQTERNFATGRASAGNKVSYSIPLSKTATATPYVGVYGDYYVSRDDASSTVTPAPMLQGWSARVTGGIGFNLGGAMVSAGGEYGGIGGTTQVWTWRARGSVPF